MCREMGAGAGAVKKGKKYGASSDPVDDQPSFDHDAWRTPKIRGQAQPASERRDIASSWSPRQGGKPVTMLKAEKPKTASSESRPVTRPLGSPQAATSPGLMDTLTSEAGIKSQTLGTSKGAMEYIPALGDEPELQKAGSTLSLGGETLDPAALLEDMELSWKKLLAKRQGASANMGALFKARQLKDDVDEAAKQLTDMQQKKAMAGSKVAGKIHQIEDACLSLEKKAVKNIGVAALWRRGDLAVRSGGNGLCEITATNQKSEMDVRMCITGIDLILDRGMLVPMTRKEMEDFRKLLSEMDAAKAEQTRLEEAVSQCCDQLRQKHDKLVEQIELELEELEKDPEFAPAGTQPQNMELVIGWNGQQQRPSQSEVPSFPQMAGLISAAEMMLKAQAEQKAAEKATKPRANEAADWVEEKDEEGQTIYRNQKTGETASELPASTKNAAAAAPFGASSPTVPAGAIPPWAKAPPKPQNGLWREPGLAMPKSKAPPPMPKGPEALERLQKLKEEAANLQETQGLSRSLGPGGKVPGPPTAGSSLGPAAAAAAKAAATARAAAATAKAAAAAAEEKDTAAAEEVPAEKPEEVKAPTTHWTEVQTEEGDIYYHNEETDETAWELPPGGVLKVPEAADPGAEGQSVEAPTTYWSPVTTEDGETYYYNLETGEAAWELPANGQIAPTGETYGAWMECQTPEGHLYYYNQQTGETSWEPSAQTAQPAPAQAAQAAQANPYNPYAQAEEAARMQRQQYEDALHSMQQAEELARQQRQQWDQIYAQHFAWYQQQQQQQAQAAQQAQAQQQEIGRAHV